MDCLYILKLLLDSFVAMVSFTTQVSLCGTPPLYSVMYFQAWITEEPRVWKGGGTPFDDPNTMSEAEVIIQGGELLCGVLDKTHYGATPYGLVHCINEVICVGKYGRKAVKVDV
jgi:hypothetical protein